jgi:hypothetical protein
MEIRRKKVAVAVLEKLSGSAGSLLVFIGIFSMFFGGSPVAEAATLYLSPASGNFHENENFTVSVFVDSDTAVNAVQGTVSFPTEYLGVISVKSDGNSIVDLWVRKPSFSNSGTSGNVYFEGMALNPGFTGSNGRVFDIIFRVKKEGRAEIDFSESSVLANDGLGTNVLTSNGKADVSLLPQRAVPEPSPSKGLESMEKRIQDVEEKIKLTEPAGEETWITRFQSFLPEGLMSLVFILAGLVALLLSIIVLGFIVVVLVWFWNYFWRRRRKIEHRVESLPHKIGVVVKEVSGFVKSAEQEVEGDVKYGLHELKKDIIEAENSRSLGKTLKDYWISVLKIFKRFTTKNVKTEKEE